MNEFHELLGTELPIIQAPMAGVQGSAMAIAVSNAGGLGSLPCAMLSPAQMRTELAAVRAATDKPVNVNFFCHTPPQPDAAREGAWRNALAKYYAEFDVDIERIGAGSTRTPFGSEAADLLDEFKPRVVSFHFGLPSAELLARVRASGCTILASTTTVGTCARSFVRVASSRFRRSESLIPNLAKGETYPSMMAKM